MNRNHPKILRNRKRRIERSWAPRNGEDPQEPMMRGSKIHYALSGKMEGASYGGRGAMHPMAQSLGLVQARIFHDEFG